MISRREFVKAISAACAVGLQKVQASTGLLAQLAPASSSDDFIRYVKAKIGTGGHGHCYPGASVPFGMVQLSPDTYNHEWDWCSGYNYVDNSIMGFSHTHLSGTGVGDMLDFLVMPRTGPVKIMPGTRENPSEGYRSHFSHDDEITSPGYYSVILQDYKIHAELSATERAGIHRYSFPEDRSTHIIVDLDHSYSDASDQKPVKWASLKVVGNDTVVGGRRFCESPVGLEKPPPI